jgi:ribosome-binding factor A
MKGRGDRPARVAERVREEISLILQHRMKDPGLDGITVTEVSMTGDLKIARIRYSVLGGEGERAAARDALRRSGGFIRRELGRSLGMRYSPELTFHFDASFERGARVSALLKDAGGEPSDEE